MIAQSLLREIDRGRAGKNQGFSMGLPKLEGVVDGVCQGTYTLLFAKTGVGKSSMALYAYVYNPLKQHLEDGNFHVSYFSLELSRQMIFAKLLCLYLFDTYGVNISVKELLSRKKSYRLDDSIYQLVLDSQEWLNRVEKVVTVYDKTCNARYLYDKLVTELKARGKFETIGDNIVYTADNPDLIHEVVIDHISLIRPKQGNSLKDEIDEVSKNLVELKNIASISPTIIMQTNRNADDVERRKQGLSLPGLQDTKDSGNVSQDCEVAIALFSPNHEKLATHNKYNIKALGDCFRSIVILKSRYGESNLEIPVNFFGRNGYFVELPKAEDINDWDKYTSINYLLSNEETEEKPDLVEHNYNFLM